MNNYIEEIAEKKGIDKDIINSRIEAFLYVAYYDKKINKKDRNLIKKSQYLILNFLYNQENKIYEIRSKKDELNNVLNFNENNRQKELLEYSFCELEVDGLVESSGGYKLQLTKQGINYFEKILR